MAARCELFKLGRVWPWDGVDGLAHSPRLGGDGDLGLHLAGGHKCTAIGILLVYGCVYI